MHNAIFVAALFPQPPPNLIQTSAQSAFEGVELGNRGGGGEFITCTGDFTAAGDVPLPNRVPFLCHLSSRLPLALRRPHSRCAPKCTFGETRRRAHKNHLSLFSSPVPFAKHMNEHFRHSEQLKFTAHAVHGIISSQFFLLASKLVNRSNAFRHNSSIVFFLFLFFSFLKKNQNCDIFPLALAVMSKWQSRKKLR